MLANASKAGFDQVKKLRSVINYVSFILFYFMTCKLILSKIRNSSLRRDLFSRILVELHPNKTPLQLIRDVETRWSSTFLMIRRALDLREVCFKN